MNCSHKSIFFLSSNSIIHKIAYTKINSIIISNYAPVTLSLNIESTVTSFPTSNLIFHYSKDPFIKEEWTSFMEMNNSPNTSPTLLWETWKVVITGRIISYSSYKKKEVHNLQNTLENKIKILTDNYASNPTEQTWQEWQTIKFQLNNILTKKTGFLLQQLRYNSYEHLSSCPVHDCSCAHTSL